MENENKKIKVRISTIILTVLLVLSVIIIYIGAIKISDLNKQIKKLENIKNNKNEVTSTKINNTNEIIENEGDVQYYDKKAISLNGKNYIVGYTITELTDKHITGDPHNNIEYRRSKMQNNNVL